jgi:hypothetical protein
MVTPEVANNIVLPFILALASFLVGVTVMVEFAFATVAV